MVGTNHDEGTLLQSSFFAKEVANETEYRAALAVPFGANADAVAAHYPVSGFASANRALAEVTTDFGFVCPARRMARGTAAAGAPIFRYSFDHPLAQPVFPDLGVFHTAELPFVFDTSDVFPLGKIDAPALVDDVQSHWIEFATFGHPGVQWPAYDAATPISSSTSRPRKARSCAPVCATSGTRYDAIPVWSGRQPLTGVCVRRGRTGRVINGLAVAQPLLYRRP